MFPCRDEPPFFVSKEASGKTQKATLAWGIGTVKRVTGWALASKRTRLASNKSSTHALGIADWRSPTLAQISGPGLDCCILQGTADLSQTLPLLLGDRSLRFLASMFQNLDGFDLYRFVLHTFFGTSQYCRLPFDGNGFHRNQTPWYWKHQKNTSPGVSQWLPYSNRPHPYAIIDMHAYIWHLEW